MIVYYQTKDTFWRIAMITKEIIDKVTNGVCAIGYLSVPLEEYRKNTLSPFFQIIGTGFLVRPTTVITN